MFGRFGQDVSRGKCVLLSTSKSVRKAMKFWDVSGSGGFRTVQLDVGDLGHLDFTLGAWAGTLSKRVRDALLGLLQVFRLSRGKYLPAGFHAAHLMSPPRLLVLLGLLLFVRFGPVRCLLLMPLLFLTCLMGLLMLILLSTLFGPGSV